MAIPKENRQQMINMMYLVLTALLALNVSAEIVNAFKTINKSLENSKKSADTNLQSTFNAFDAKKAKEPGNASIGKYLDLANQSKSTFDGLLGYIAKLKNEVVTRAGGPDVDDPNGILMRKDDMDVSTGFLVEGTSGDNGEGHNLKKQIDQALSSVMNLVEPTDKDQVKALISLSTEPSSKGGDWVKEQFYQMPAVASYAMLTKLENDVKNTQGTLTGYFFSKIGRAQELTNDQIVFDKFSASLSSPSSYILAGETFMADISLAATSSKAAGTVSVNVNGQNVPVDPATGIAHYKASPGVGEHSIRGSVSVKNDRTGQVTSYPLPDYKLTVAAPFATVSPTKMNVFYIGVDNPVDVSAAGTAAKDLSVSMSGGSISGGGGKYTVRVQNPGEANVNVSGKGKPFGSFKFRVKMIPNPVPKLSGKTSGRFPAGEFKAQAGPYAELENFDFDAKFQITSFSLFYQPKGGDPAQLSTSGTLFNAPMKAVIAKAKPGDIYYIEDIKAVGPDGRSRSLPALAFKIN